MAVRHADRADCAGPDVPVENDEPPSDYHDANSADGVKASRLGAWFLHLLHALSVVSPIIHNR